MEWFLTLLTQNASLAIIAMLVFILGGIVNIFLIAERKFGWFGTKHPDLTDAFQKLSEQIATVHEEVHLTNSNHLSHLPEAELAIQRIESYAIANTRLLEKMNDTLVEIKVLIDKK